jgi:hypothetical protein
MISTVMFSKANPSVTGRSVRSDTSPLSVCYTHHTAYQDWLATGKCPILIRPIDIRGPAYAEIRDRIRHANKQPERGHGRFDLLKD